MAYDEFLNLVDDVANAVRTDKKIVKNGYEWTFDQSLYYVQQIMIFLSDKRKCGFDVNKALDQRIEVRYEKGPDHSHKMRKKSEESSVTDDSADCNIAQN